MGACASVRPKSNVSRLSRVIVDKAFNQKQRRRVLLIGLDGAGKTTILYLLSKGKQAMDLTTPIVPTEGFNAETVRMSGLELTLWDVSGRHKTRTQHWRHYYTGVQGLVFVVDSADEERLHLAAKELISALRDDQLFMASVLILANKSDLANAKSVEEIEKALALDDSGEARKILGNRPFKIISTSAIKGSGIRESFTWLCNSMTPI